MQVSAFHNDRQQAVAQRGQRIKVGLIGLGAVLLLIGLASAVFNSVNRERPVTAIGTAQPGRVAEMANTADTVSATNEPLAELGVAPPATPPATGEPVNRSTQTRR